LRIELGEEETLAAGTEDCVATRLSPRIPIDATAGLCDAMRR
jgi:hypothetical protein